LAVVREFIGVGGVGGVLEIIERKVVVFTCWEQLGQRGWMRRWASSMKALKSLVHELQDAFGGELEVDDILCYKNRVQTANPFPVIPRPSASSEGIEPEDIQDFVSNREGLEGKQIVGIHSIIPISLA